MMSTILLAGFDLVMPSNRADEVVIRKAIAYPIVPKLFEPGLHLMAADDRYFTAVARLIHICNR